MIGAFCVLLKKCLTQVCENSHLCFNIEPLKYLLLHFDLLLQIAFFEQCGIDKIILLVFVFNIII